MRSRPPSSPRLGTYRGAARPRRAPARDACALAVVALLAVSAAAFAQPLTNVALRSHGAIASDNGFFNDPGYAPTPASNVIDGDWTTYWAGLTHRSPQMVWIDFDRPYVVSRVVIGERPEAFVRRGLLEYFDGWRWHPIADIDKSSPGFVLAFPSVEALAVRLSVYGYTAPSSWYNRVATITQIEVYGEAHARPAPPACRDGRIGLTINDGLEVTGFAPRSPAQFAGLRFGDIIRSIHGVPPSSIAHAQALAAGPPGSLVTVTVWRHTTGRNLTFTIELGCD